MADPQSRLNQMPAKLKTGGFRITPQRLAVLKILASSDGHPSVERIYEQVKENFATTSLATIYETVLLLKQLNEILEPGFPDGSNRYDGNQPYPHPHIICTRCKRITDSDLGSMAQFAAEAAPKTGYDILGAAKCIQMRQTALFFKADADYGRRVAAGFGWISLRWNAWRPCLRQNGRKPPRREPSAERGYKGSLPGLLREGQPGA